MSRSHTSYKRQAGAAVFMALLIMTLVVAMSVTWFMQNRISIRHTEQMLISDQAYLYSQSVIDWAISEIQAAKSTNNGWPRLFPETQIANNQGFVSGRIDDYQARLNINNMADAATQKAFIKLLSLVDASINEKSALAIKDAILAWITPMSALTPSMLVIDAGYKKIIPPYHAANRPMQSISELRMIAGVTSDLYLLLESYLSALPPRIPTNFTYASPMIINAFNMAESASAAEEPSQYYLVRVDVQLSHQYLVLYNLLHRTNRNGKVQVGIVWQGRGTL